MLQLMKTFVRFQQRSNIILINAIILFAILLEITSRKIVYSKLSGAFTYSDVDWFVSNNDFSLYLVNTCGYSNILFLENFSKIDNSLISKTFQLEPHYQITISFKF
ncbi:unnamed protein product [Paramecium primaurelia]|uniref:Uncharacterized protein n=1 Tax=Paramecium primaurelia TaxID=5886 RepID=A0A8S1P9W6_PARPR|nr:unnamed protein product [Paramecium primaurelia]